MNDGESTTAAKFPNIPLPANKETPEKSEAPPEENPSPKPRYKYDLKVGAKDGKGNEIKYIYACVDGKYCIYHIGDYDIQIIAEDETIMSKDAKMNTLFLTVGDYFANNYNVRAKYISYMAYAVKTFYDGNIDNACEALTLTHKNILRYLERKAEFAYLTGAFIMVLIALVSYLVVYKIGEYEKFGQLSELGYILFCAVCFSAIGGLLSVSTSSGKIKVDVQNHFKTKAFYGATRIIIAIISGVVAYFLIESKFLFAFIKDAKDAGNIHAYYVAFFVAGFSEKLIPNIMLDFDKKDSSTNTKPDPKDN